MSGNIATASVVLGLGVLRLVHAASEGQVEEVVLPEPRLVLVFEVLGSPLPANAKMAMLTAARARAPPPMMRGMGEDFLLVLGAAGWATGAAG